MFVGSLQWIEGIDDVCKITSEERGIMFVRLLEGIEGTDLVFWIT